MSLIKAIKARRSSAKISAADVAPEMIIQLLDAAVCTPVHYQTNPWRFLVIRGEGRKKLGEVMENRLVKTMTNPEEPKNIAQREKMREKPFRAPVIIAVGAAKSDCAKALMKEDVASVNAACQNILLAAHELGLSAIWRTGSFTYDPVTSAALGFEVDTELAGFIYLGHPLKALPPKSRETSAAYVRWLD